MGECFESCSKVEERAARDQEQVSKGEGSWPRRRAPFGLSHLQGARFSVRDEVVETSREYQGAVRDALQPPSFSFATLTPLAFGRAVRTPTAAKYEHDPASVSAHVICQYVLNPKVQRRGRKQAQAASTELRRSLSLFNSDQAERTLAQYHTHPLYSLAHKPQATSLLYPTKPTKFSNAPSARLRNSGNFLRSIFLVCGAYVRERA